MDRLMVTIKRDDAGISEAELATLTPEQREAIEFYESLAPDAEPDEDPFNGLPYDDVLDPDTNEPIRGRGL